MGTMRCRPSDCHAHFYPQYTVSCSYVNEILTNGFYDFLPCDRKRNKTERWLGMFNFKPVFFVVVVVLCALPAVGKGGADDSTDFQWEIDAIKARFSRMEKSQQQSWLNGQRMEEVKNLVREVLVDAETRSSLLENGIYAGHDGKHFFLKSAGGDYLLSIAGQIQVRHIYNNQNQSADDEEYGFAIRRTKMKFSGHVANPRIKYGIQLAVQQDNNMVNSDLITLGYQLTDGMYIWIGEDKGPFLREETTSSKNQLAIERSYVNEIFTIDKVQGIGLKWKLSDRLKFESMISDGSKSGDGSTSAPRFTQRDMNDGDPNSGSQVADRNTTKLFDQDASDFSCTARINWLAAGTWKQAKDFSSWPGEDMAILVGGALHYETGETGDAFLNNNFISWMVDASIESQGWSAFVALIGQSMDLDNSAPLAFNKYDLWGLVCQGSYNMSMGGHSLEPFVRWEHLDFDDLLTDAAIQDQDEVDLLTFGTNYYLSRHNAKFSVDLLLALDSIPFGSSSVHLLSDAFGEDNQTVLRAQFQLLF